MQNLEIKQNISLIGQSPPAGSNGSPRRLPKHKRTLIFQINIKLLSSE